jgi:hypothetical protein
MEAQGGAPAGNPYSPTMAVIKAAQAQYGARPTTMAGAQATGGNLGALLAGMGK